MPSFGQSSSIRLKTCHPVLRDLMQAVVVERDCSIVCGYRSPEEQNELYKIGREKSGNILTYARGGQSKHNFLPSHAVDVVPWPEKWDSPEAFFDLAEVIARKWREMPDEKKRGFTLRWGADWDGDGDRTDQTFNDLPHWELVKPE